MSNDNYIRKISKSIRKNFDNSELPENGLDDLFDIYAVLALAKSASVTDEDVHNAWSAWATKYDSTNSSIIPYSELSQEIKIADRKFTIAIRNIASTLGQR